MSARAKGNDGMAFFPVGPGETVTAWALSPLDTAYYPGKPAPAEDRVNYRFINGFVDVGDLPCRVAWWAEVKTRKVELETDWPVDTVNLPGFNRRLEFSGFWHRPTRLRRWCCTVLVPPEGGDCRFRLATCGGVHIWVDGVLAIKFEPFTRNEEQATEIVLPLKSGGSEVVMLSEDLAERDTNWYVELTSLCDEALQAGVPGGANAADLATLMRLAADVRPEREVFTGGPLVLAFDTPAASDVTVTAKVQQSVHMRHKPPLFTARAVLDAGGTQVALAGLEGLAGGYHPLDLTFEIGEARVERHVGFALLRETVPPARAADLQGRKREALAFAAAHGDLRVGRALAMLAMGGEAGLSHMDSESLLEPPPPTPPLKGEGDTETLAPPSPLRGGVRGGGSGEASKNDSYAIALGGKADDTLVSIVSDTLTMIDERRDCSDFVMVPLLWLYGAYGEALPAATAARIRRSVLDYRYWVDEPGNDVMWFWSENHVLCFHVSQYLAGRLLPEDTFTASGRTGREQAALAAERLGKWFGSVEAHGLAEWNSAAYYPIDFIGLLALQHWADGALRERTEKLLDRLFTMIALHTLGGVSAGTMGRAYDKELRAGPLTELSPFATVAFGTGWLNNGVAALPMFAAGNYTPPQGLSRYASPPEGRALIAHYVQGYDNAAKLALYKRAAVQLSASVDGTPGQHGHQQHVMDILFASHPFARAWINHPGEDDPWGHHRPSYWAGNGVMPRVGSHEDALLMLYDLKGARVDFTHVYAPEDGFDERVLKDNWLILRAGRGFAALTASAPIVKVSEGPGAGCEYRAYGRKVAWAALVGELPQGADTSTVAKTLTGTSLAFDAGAMRATLTRTGRATLVLDYARGLSVDGTPFVFPNPGLEPLVREIAAPVLS
ncbi:hypothetical protein [Chelativorans alearense]|uniref:hypothetical protein n=1 Tax=Chelativorans alearense TaxID=2681495 RepID=UPI0013D550BC|nr:hypothetical protein [Chelativorans alearense]